MRPDRKRPQDWRLAGVSVGAWVGAVLGTGGVPVLACIVASSTIVIVTAGFHPRVLAGAVAVFFGFSAGITTGSLQFWYYENDAAVVHASTSDSAELLVRVTQPAQTRQTPWGTVTESATASVLAIRRGSLWQTSRVNVRLAGPEGTLSEAISGDLAVTYGKIRQEFWENPPTIGELRILTFRKVGGGTRWERMTGDVRTRMLELTKKLPQPAGALILGMSVGDRQLLDESTSTSMMTSSLTHLTAISGTHIGLALAALVLMLPGGSLWRPMGMIIFLTFLTGVVGPTPSVLRASAMAIVTMVTLLRHRPSQPQVALLLVVLAFSLVEPWITRQAGFVMSVLATAGILISGRSWGRRLASWTEQKVPENRPLSRSLVKKASELIAVSAAASLWVLPPLVGLTENVPTWSILANLLAAPAVAPVSLLGITAAVFSSWAPPVAVVLLWLAVPFATWIALVATMVSTIPGALLPWPSGPLGIVAAGTLIGLVTAIDVATRRKGEQRGAGNQA